MDMKAALEMTAFQEKKKKKERRLFATCKHI